MAQSRKGAQRPILNAHIKNGEFDDFRLLLVKRIKEKASGPDGETVTLSTKEWAQIACGVSDPENSVIRLLELLYKLAPGLACFLLGTLSEKFESEEEKLDEQNGFWDTLARTARSISTKESEVYVLAMRENGRIETPPMAAQRVYNELVTRRTPGSITPIAYKSIMAQFGIGLQNPPKPKPPQAPPETEATASESTTEAAAPTTEVAPESSDSDTQSVPAAEPTTEAASPTTEGVTEEADIDAELARLDALAPPKDEPKRKKQKHAPATPTSDGRTAFQIAFDSARRDNKNGSTTPAGS